MPLKTFIYPPGTRVRVRRGEFPMDPSVVGRTGLVVEVDDYRPKHYAVILDGETALRDLLENELEPLTAPSDAREQDATGTSPKTTLRSPG